MNVMLDLETLGTKPGSVILSIGAVEFDKTGMYREFYKEISVASSNNWGLTADQSTIEWWGKQSPEARATFDRCHTSEPDGLNDTLVEFTEWLHFCKGGIDKLKLWGNGSDFDNVLLDAAYRAAGLAYPIKYWNHRCFRSLKGLPMVNGKGLEPIRAGTHHNALDDAKHQALWALAILQKLYSAEEAAKQVAQQAAACKDAAYQSDKARANAGPAVHSWPFPKGIAPGEPPPKLYERKLPAKEDFLSNPMFIEGEPVNRPPLTGKPSNDT